MKITFIIPGSGDSFYCGNCFRDNLHASALRKAGHEVLIMPLYLPLKHESFQADSPLFFPATTYYTEQKFFKKRKMPTWLEKLTKSKTVLDLASSMSGTTSAKGMEDMTLSMITGEDPAFDKHVRQLTTWIKEQEKPEVIHLSSSLLIGIAKTLKQELNIPIVCSLQDEEVWIDSLNKIHADTAWQGIDENIKYIDHFVVSSEFYKNAVLKKHPQIQNIALIYPGVDRQKYEARDYPQQPTIGFFYRMNYENGLDILADAFVKLKKNNKIQGLKLKIGGGYSGKDKKFLNKVRKTLAPYKADVEICNVYSLDEHLSFYKSISLISVPIRFEESVGLYLCEAFAAGRPAVEPSSGSFPEIVGDAGKLYHPNNSNALADALNELLSKEDAYAEAAAKAKELSQTRYNDKVLTDKLISLYETSTTNKIKHTGGGW
ncbi:MAG: glycosyltransferase family 4 protein [Bacteroidales bacterium]